MGKLVGTAREAGARWARRIAAVVVVTAVCLVTAPGVSSAAPTRPSDGQINAAQQSKDAAAQAVARLSAALIAAQAQMDAANAAAAIALDTFEGKQADYEAAAASAVAAAASARKAAVDLATSRTELATFARASYIQGTTSPGIEALMASGGPTQMMERAALLDAAGHHRSDVVDQFAVAQQRAAAADAAAQTALTRADALKQQAADALKSAEQVQVGARQQATAFQAQQTDMQNRLQQAQQTLLGLQGARAAADEYAQRQVAAQAAAERAVRQLPAPTTAAGSGSSSAARTAINAAMQYIGTRYAWGGGTLTGPSGGWGIDDGVVGFDCSGLTRYAYAQAGISITRQSTQQYVTLPKVSRSNLAPGDLVFWATNTGSPSTIHHVAIWLGGSQILEAPESGEHVRVAAMRWTGFIGAVRPSA